MPHATLLWVIAAAGAIGAWLWCLIVLPGTPETFPVGDGAVIELYTLHVTRGWWAWGPYSRFEWHHPGPLGFYLLAPFYATSHLQFLALNAGALTINVMALATIGWCLARYTSATFGLTMSLALGWYLWRLPEVIVSAWNPHLVLLPLAATIVASAVVASGRLALLPVAIAFASFVAQTHVGLVPSAAIAIACALVAGLRQRAASSSAARWLAISAALGVVLWLPVIVEQLTAADGNLSKLARFFLLPHDVAPLPFLEATTVWIHAMAAALQPQLRLPVGHGYPTTAGVWLTMTTIAGVVMLGVAGWWASRRDQRVEAWSCWLSAALSIGALVAIARIRGGVADHLVAWVPVIALVGSASLAAVGVARITSRSTRLTWEPDRAHWLTTAATLVLIAGALVSGARQLEAQRAESIRVAASPRTPVEAIFGATRAFIAKAHVNKPLIHPAATAWGEAAGIVVPLYKRRVPFAIASESLWLFGDQFAADGTEDADLTIADRLARPLVEQRDGNCLLMERHGLSLHLLRSSLKTPTSVTCE